MTHTCAHPHCELEATFPAPRDPRNISERQYFCEAHIKEFNKKWNGLQGFSEDDIHAMEDKATYNRPTWKFGIHGASARGAQLNLESADDLFAFFKARRMEEIAKGRAQGSGPSLPPDVKESCAVLGVEPPLNGAALKKKYLSLMKKHHPDVNQGNPQAEEMVKKINVAYQILGDYIGS